jgi:hypothetical protein
MEEELAIIAMMIKTLLLERGETYGHMATAVNQDSHHRVMGVNTFIYNWPNNPGSYHTTITATTSEPTHRKTEAKHRIKPEDWKNLRVEEALKKS